MGDSPMKINNKEYSCAIELTLDIIGGKWKPIILWKLAQNDVLRFSELKRSMGVITQKMLTQQLRELEAYEILLYYGITLNCVYFYLCGTCRNKCFIIHEEKQSYT